MLSRPVLVLACGLALQAAPALASPDAASGQPQQQLPPKDSDARRQWLKARLDEIFSAAPVARAKVSAVVMDPETGRMIYGKNERVGLNAASNVKIATETAALALLGPEFRWKTTVLAAAPSEGGKPISSGELHGDLYVKTSGDPTLSTQDLAALASSLYAVGLRKVHGALIVDATAFDAGNLAPAFDQKDDCAAFRAPSSAASLNANTVTVTIAPGPTPGSLARITVEPASPALTLVGTVTTASKGPVSANVETSDGGSGQTRIAVSGRILAGSEPRVFSRRVVTPETYFAQTFKQILGKRGITIDKPARAGEAPKEGLRVLATHESPNLAVVAHELGKRSSNFGAEQILRTLGGESMGRPGTWQKGLETVARYLESIGIPRGSYVMKNGSGLYDSNRFSAEQMATILRAATRDFRISSEFLASLAVGGADGTLAHRMAGSAAERFVRAKTGTLANVSCLSGIVGAPAGKPLIFSILINDVSSAVAARAAQDNATAALVTFLDK